MNERPIRCYAHEVRAILSGRMTQMRRVVKQMTMSHTRTGEVIGCPYGVPGDHLWVRESFIHEPDEYCWEASSSVPVRPAFTIYRADAEDPRGGRWSPSIHMPRALSRIDLEVTGVRVERLQDISEADAKAEGASFHDGRGIGRSGWRHDCGAVHADARSAFARLWESINGAGSWDANPWVWVVEFRRVRP